MLSHPRYKCIRMLEMDQPDLPQLVQIMNKSAHTTQFSTQYDINTPQFWEEFNSPTSVSKSSGFFKHI